MVRLTTLPRLGNPTTSVIAVSYSGYPHGCPLFCVVRRRSILYGAAMPAAEQFTPTFVESFVTRCHAEGLTKEATTYLLELSAISAAHQQPGFAAGFNARMSEGGLEKSAWATAGKLMAGGLGLGAAAGGVGYGIHKARDAYHNRNRGAWADVPNIGGYDPAANAQNYRDKLDGLSEGIGDLNARVDANGKRSYELQEAIDSGEADSGALKELRRLRSDPSAYQRRQYGQQLEEYNRNIGGNLRTAQEDLDKLDRTRNSWWGKARQFFGHNYNPREDELTDQAFRLRQQQKLSEQLRNRLRSGATSFDSNGPPAYEDIQSRFFRTR